MCQKSRTLHISLLFVDQSLKNPNVKLGFKLKILPLRWGFFFLFSLQLSKLCPMSPQGEGGGVGVSSDKCITTTGARRSKGHTNPVNLANLVERGKSYSSLHLSTAELKLNCPKICRPRFSSILVETSPPPSLIFSTHGKKTRRAWLHELGCPGL